MEQYKYGEKWDDTIYPINRIVVKLYPDGSEEEIYRSTADMESGELLAYDEVKEYIKRVSNYGTR
jgi:hypothetical protein